MREVNEMCAPVFWSLAEEEKRTIYEAAGRKPKELPEGEIHMNAAEFCRLADRGSRRMPVRPKKAILQVLTVKMDALSLPGGMHRVLYSDDMWVRKFMLTNLELLYVSDGKNNVYCSVIVDYEDEGGAHHVDVGCLRFYAAKGAPCFYVIPWSMNVKLGEDFADEETMCNIASLLANLWNGAQLLLKHCPADKKKALEDFFEECEKLRKESK